MRVCPCGSGKLFSRCCERFLSAGAVAKTPEQLMRSRYSAFALGGFGAYLLATWSARVRDQYSAADLSVRSLDWCGLEVVDKAQSGDAGEVEFKAWFVDADGARQVHHERSRFERVAGRWFYVDGSIF